MVFCWMLNIIYSLLLLLDGEIYGSVLNCILFMLRVLHNGKINFAWKVWTPSVFPNMFWYSVLHITIMLFSVYMCARLVQACMAQMALKYTYFWDTLYCLYFKMLKRSLLNNYEYVKMMKYILINEFKINFIL